MSKSLPDEVSILIDEDGDASFIYDEELLAILAAECDEADIHINRASRVEPAGVGREFNADMALSGGPNLGNFPTYKAAVDAEVDWLKKEVFYA